jgi:hypothetical protein
VSSPRHRHFSLFNLLSRHGPDLPRWCRSAPEPSSTPTTALLAGPVPRAGDLHSPRHCASPVRICSLDIAWWVCLASVVLDVKIPSWVDLRLHAAGARWNVLPQHSRQEPTAASWAGLVVGGAPGHYARPCAELAGPHCRPASPVGLGRKLSFCPCARFNLKFPFNF